jgi:hypothetical protein
MKTVGLQKSGVFFTDKIAKPRINRRGLKKYKYDTLLSDSVWYSEIIKTKGGFVEMNAERYCQSCGMPLPTEELLGTHRDGSRNQDYCVYCFKDGDFTAVCNMEEMVKQCVPFAIEAGAYSDPETARAAMLKFFPTLKRWRN